MTDLATKAPDHGYSGEHELGTVERVLAAGDLSKLGPEDRARYLFEVCRSLGLNPLTMPFQYLLLNGKLVLYATRGATDQLRRVHHVSTTILSRETVGDVYVVTARATDRAGRSDESIGAVAIGGLKGEPLCNALMKAESKAKRRATLALVGLGILDDSEVDTIPGARRLDPDAELEPPPVAGALTPRGEAMTAAWDREMAEADALLAEPVREAVVPEVLGDDVESLTGDALVEACNRMRRALVANNLPFAEIPFGQDKTVNKLRLWWRQAAAVLAARQQAR